MARKPPYRPPHDGLQRALAGKSRRALTTRGRPGGSVRPPGGGRPKVPRPPASATSKAPRPLDPIIQAVTQPQAAQATPTGPYQGAAGSETPSSGPRTPPPDWADPSSPNYERRNYYIDPVTGLVVNREPGYYNPENPWDTGRPNETQGEYGRTYGYGADAIAPYERRMDEPGITPWGPGGKASPAGAFPAPGGVHRPPPQILSALGQQTSLASEFANYGNSEAGDLSAGKLDPSQFPDELLSLIRALIPQLPRSVTSRGGLGPNRGGLGRV